ncbi:MAG TPA: hypothetical protein VI172_04030 [Candidatus Dormibacteraeota bacterium]|jgi:hypothetical protein
MPDLAKELVAARAENEALKQAFGTLAQVNGQRSQLVFSMWGEALSAIAEAANGGDQQAKQICRRVTDALALAKSAAGGIVVVK